MHRDSSATTPMTDPGGDAWAAATLARRPELLGRFQAALDRLRALPGGARRRIQRRAAVSLAGAALLLAMSGSPLLIPRVHAATITVGGTCSLVDAIRSANNDTSYGTCVAGGGADTINLTGDVTLTTSYGSYPGGDAGLPLIDTPITINGNGSTISRDGAAPNFRLMVVGPSGDLTLNDVTLSGGYADYGGAVLLYFSSLTITNSTLSGNYAENYGGAIFGGEDSTVTITNSTLTDNSADTNGGAIYVDEGSLTINRSTLSDNEASSNGGAVYSNAGGVIDITDSTLSDNYANSSGGAIRFFDSAVTITGSTLSGNTANNGGGGIYNDNHGQLSLTNSTISGNEAGGDGGGIYTDQHATTTITNSTITDNTASDYGGGVYGWNNSTTILVRSIVSGNSASKGDEVGRDNSGGTMTADADNVFGHSAIANADAFYYFTPGSGDVTATSDGTLPTALAAILDTTLADNGGPTETHALVSGSPAVDLAPDADCTAAPTNGVDQRGAARPFDGDGSASPNECDTGAVEYLSPAPGGIFVSALTAGTTDDNVSFGPHDILMWGGGGWSKWFDGTAAGLTPGGVAKHHINALWIPDTAEEDVLLSFIQNARVVPGVPGKVNGMDLVWWDGDAFTMWFDGEDVGLTNKTQEKIDAVHVLPGSMSPVGAGCLNYLLVSTQGPGAVPGGSGPIRFRGEDVLGFCQTNVGANTTGVWHLLLDGRAEGMSRGATNSISVSDDGQTMYLTTNGTFIVDSAAGGHSMVYTYDFASGEFSGPIFSAPAEGLSQKVNGLHVVPSALD